MIRQTCLEIDELKARHAWERLQRRARRQRIRYIDDLINEFEMLNLAEEVRIPEELRRRATLLLTGLRHPLGRRPTEESGVGEWMDALYEVQDGLLLGTAEEPD